MSQHPCPLVAGQALTREAVQAARPPRGKLLRGDAAVEVYVACSRCGDFVRTWVTPKDGEAPTVYCNYCEWWFEQPEE